MARDADGDFVVVWASDKQDGDDIGVFAQRYDRFGNALGTEFQVNHYTTSYQGSPSVAMDADGNFVVAWASYEQDGNSYEVYAQRYDSNGQPVGSEFLVNTYTFGAQNYPSVGMDADGDFVIVWESVAPGQGGDLESIYGQRYDQNGNPIGLEFRINHFADYQQHPSVAMDADGNFIIVWQSAEQGGDGYDIYGQRYDRDGKTVGVQFRANTYTTDSQKNASVAMDADGDFVIAWESLGQDGDGVEIYAQRYDHSGNPVRVPGQYL